MRPSDEPVDKIGGGQSPAIRGTHPARRDEEYSRDCHGGPPGFRDNESSHNNNSRPNNNNNRSDFPNNEIDQRRDLYNNGPGSTKPPQSQPQGETVDRGRDFP